MFALLIGFIVPAVLFAMFAIFACLKRFCGIPLFQPTYMRALSDDVGSYQNTYHDHHFVHYLPTLPPSYSEAMNLQVPHHIIEQKIPRRYLF
uniref:Secreted protein n=1 Tax=Parascaris equorum TaxID=6256 RepID=A0A914RGD2_PAREQ